MNDTASAYRPDIDGLRAVAVILVVLFHAFPHQVPYGFIGVDIFFVISGYLITQIILREHQAGSFSLLNFYARRCRRILPALLLVIVSIWGVGWFALLAGEFTHLGRHVQAGAMFLSNFQSFREAGYFDFGAEWKPLLHLWSLSVEEQYYLVYPMLLILLLQRGRSIVWWMGGIGALSLAFNIASVHAGHSAFAFYFLPSRFWELLLGGLLAALPAARQRSTLWETNALSTVALVTIVLASFRMDPADLYPGWFALVPTLATVLCISSGASSQVNRFVLGHKAMVILGRMSYALYLWHWPILSFARIAQEGEPSVNQRVLLIAVSLLIAYLTWRLVEIPAHSYRLPAFNLGRNRRVLLWSSAGLGTAFLLGAVTAIHQGFPARYPDLETVAESYGRTRTPSCAKKYLTQDAYCIETGDAPKIAVIGDSFAHSFFQGLLASSFSIRHSLILLGAHSCPFLTDVTVEVNPGCLESNRRINEVIERPLSLEVVVLFLRGPRYLSPPQASDASYQSAAEWRMRGITVDTRGLTPVALLTVGMSRTIAKLERSGTKVVVFLPWPELNFNPMTCLDRRPLRLWPVEIKTPCAMPLAEVRERQAEYRALLSELKSTHPDLVLFDPLPYLCDAENCWAARSGRLDYMEAVHLNIHGAGILEPAFVHLLVGLVEDLWSDNR